MTNKFETETESPNRYRPDLMGNEAEMEIQGEAESLTAEMEQAAEDGTLDAVEMLRKIVEMMDTAAEIAIDDLRGNVEQEVEDIKSRLIDRLEELAEESEPEPESDEDEDEDEDDEDETDEDEDA